MDLDSIKREIINHPSNAEKKKLGYEPVYTASTSSKVAIIGQAPGIRAQTTGIPWNDVSGDTLREWLSLSRDDFYNPDNIALVPMDFYFPGKAKHGDQPPRKDFAVRWHRKIFDLMPGLSLTLLVGSYAQKHYLEAAAKKNLTETVKAYQEYLPDYLPLVHPSPLTIGWRKRNPWFESEVLPKARDFIHRLI